MKKNICECVYEGCKETFVKTNGRQKYCVKHLVERRRRQLREARKRYAEKRLYDKKNKIDFEVKVNKHVRIPDRKKRLCLKCGKYFTSEGIGNRICLKCDESNKYMSHSYIY